MSDARMSNADGDTYDVLLTSAGSTKAKVYQALRDTQMMPIKKAMALVDAAPTTVAEGLDSSQARRVKAALELAGAAFELVRHGDSSAAAADVAGRSDHGP
jgi:large subunit ribosomal protein L7/L12